MFVHPVDVVILARICPLNVRRAGNGRTCLVTVSQRQFVLVGGAALVRMKQALVRLLPPVRLRAV